MMMDRLDTELLHIAGLEQNSVKLNFQMSKFF